MFATRVLRKEEKRVRSAAARLVGRLEGGKRKGARVDMLGLARSMAVDVVSECVLGMSNGGGEEGRGQGRLRASDFSNAFVGVERFFFFPNWAFRMLDKVAGYLVTTQEMNESCRRVQVFVERLVDETDVQDGTYQARMLKLDLSKEEVAAQMPGCCVC